VGRPPSRRLSPPVNAPHVDTLESRIKEELIALGLIEPQEVRCVCWFLILSSFSLSSMWEERAWVRG